METTAYRPSRTSDVGKTKTTTDSGAMSFHLASLTRADRADNSLHDPIPLFLSDPEGTPDPREFSPREARPHKSLITRIAASVLAAAAIAVLVTLFQADIGRLFALKSWMGSVAASQPTPAPLPVVRQISLKDPARVANPIQVASADPAEIAIPAAPSREAIATAYQSALQAQPPIQVAAPAVPPPAASPPAKTLDAETLAGLMTRAKSLMAIGDLAAARLLLERAANAQDAGAAFLLAQTYDPAVLGTRDTRSITADPAAARNW